MSSANLDKSLDAIIESNRPSTNRRGRRGGPGRREHRGSPYQRRSGPQASGNTPASVFAQVPVTFAPGIQGPMAQASPEVVISNLKYDVTEEDIKTLAADYGQTRRVEVYFGQDGKSKGTATVLFRNSSDAARFAQDFNGRTLDGRAMKVRFVYNPAHMQQAQQHLQYYPQSQFVPVPIGAAAAAPQQSFTVSTNGSGRRHGSGGGRRGGGNRRGTGRTNKPQVSKDELDKQLNEFMQVEE
ncbi:hypothetical protein EV182_001737 [Spiromyces aspiralis]|uniref:Uncharacterized protein n=1 Tax=Spiromyces aspiralis TaxID=68401 RepID=A0ACC1HLM9_9FUNG|nr:hypothetical protein EV182_001737 [Spiromyces aspiralis]